MCQVEKDDEIFVQVRFKKLRNTNNILKPIHCVAEDVPDALKTVLK